MKFPRLQRRTLALVAVIIPLLLLFIYVALRSGPLAPVAATVSTVESRSVAPALAGIGTVQARYLQNRPHRCRARQTLGCACRRYR